MISSILVLFPPTTAAEWIYQLWIKLWNYTGEWERKIKVPTETLSTEQSNLKRKKRKLTKWLQIKTKNWRKKLKITTVTELYFYLHSTWKLNFICESWCECLCLLSVFFRIPIWWYLRQKKEHIDLCICTDNASLLLCIWTTFKKFWENYTHKKNSHIWNSIDFIKNKSAAASIDWKQN